MSSSLPQACTGLVGRNPGAGDARKVRRRPKTSPRKQLSSGCWPEVPDPTAGEGGRGGLGKPGGGSWGILTPPPQSPVPSQGLFHPQSQADPGWRRVRPPWGQREPGDAKSPSTPPAGPKRIPKAERCPDPGGTRPHRVCVTRGGEGGGGAAKSPRTPLPFSPAAARPRSQRPPRSGPGPRPRPRRAAPSCRARRPPPPPPARSPARHVRLPSRLLSMVPGVTGACLPPPPPPQRGADRR